MGSPFVQPAVTRLPLAGNQWIDIRRELTYGETTEMYAAMRKQFAAGEMPTLDPTRIGTARALAYLVGWSFVDHKGEPVPVSRSAFNNLTNDMARAIRDALEEHEERLLQEREAEKNGPGGVSVSAPTSPSVQ